MARHSTPERLKLVYEIENLWYKGNHPQTFTEHQVMIQSHKAKLGQLRNDIVNDLTMLEASRTNINMDDIFSERNMSNCSVFADSVFDMSAKCSDNLIATTEYIVMSSMGLHEAPPCAFCVIGLGSIARGEATPYSDLEYAFIVEHDDEYFTQLAVDSYFRINNIGESPLKCFYIDELRNTVADSERSPSFVDQPPVNGFKIDGISPKAGNIPTANGLPAGRRLIQTVEGLLQIYKAELNSDLDIHKPGDLSALLGSSVLILSHDGGEKLYNQFCDRVNTYEEEEALHTKSVMLKRLITLKVDVDNHDFLPEYKDGPHYNHSRRPTAIQVKSNIFRYPTLLATNLRLSLNLATKNPWQTIDLLEAKGIMSSQSCKIIKIVLGLSIYIRTSAYVNLGSQFELLSLYPTVIWKDGLDDRYHVPNNLFAVLGCLLIPVKKAIETSVVRGKLLLANLEDFDMANFVRQSLKEIIFDPEDFLLQAEVMLFMGESKRGVSIIKSAVGAAAIDDCARFIEVIRDKYHTTMADPLEKKALVVCANLLAGIGTDRRLLGFTLWLVSYSHSPLERVMLNTRAATCLCLIGRRKQAVTMLNQAELALCSVVGANDPENLADEVIKLIRSSHPYKNHAEVAIGKLVTEIYRERCDMFCSSARKNILSYDDTIDLSLLNGDITVYFHEELQKMLKSTQFESSKSIIGLQDLKKGESILKEMASKNEDVRGLLIDVYLVMAKGYFFRRMHIESLRANLQALEICQDVYGQNSACYDLLIIYQNMLNVAFDLREWAIGGLYETLYDQINNRKEIKLQSLHIKRDESFNYTADTYHLVAVSHHSQGEYELAVKHYQQSLAMRKQTSPVDVRRCFDVSFTAMGMVDVFLDQGNPAKVLEYCNTALQTLLTHQSSNIIQLRIALAHYRMAEAHHNIGDLDNASTHNKKSLDILTTLRTTFKKQDNYREHEVLEPELWLSQSLRLFAQISLSRGNLELDLGYLTSSNFALPTELSCNSILPLIMSGIDGRPVVRLEHEEVHLVRAKLYLVTAEVWKARAQYRIAISFAKKSLEQVDNFMDSHIFLHQFDSLCAHANHVIGNCFRLENMKMYHSQAHNHLHKALGKHEATPICIQKDLNVADVHLSFAQLYFNLGSRDTAEQHTNTAIALTTKLIEDNEITPKRCKSVYKEAVELRETIKH